MRMAVCAQIQLHWLVRSADVPSILGYSIYKILIELHRAVAVAAAVAVAVAAMCLVVLALLEQEGVCLIVHHSELRANSC
jgi:hypothetical protein